jgi:hypothetical protein
MRDLDGAARQLAASCQHQRCLLDAGISDARISENLHHRVSRHHGFFLEHPHPDGLAGLDGDGADAALFMGD